MGCGAASSSRFKAMFRVKADDVGRQRCMRVILDCGGRRAFASPRQVIRADRAEEVPAALAAVEAALAQGRHVAGWLGYELGYVLEPRLVRLMPERRPLLRLGVFDGPQRSAASRRAAPMPGRWPLNGTRPPMAARFRPVKDRSPPATSIRPISASAPASPSPAIRGPCTSDCGRPRRGALRLCR